MAANTLPPFRADHVGSLLRPQRLLDARARKAAGEIDADTLRAVEDDCVREAVALQADAGLLSATDGEYRRTSWHMDFIYSLGGVAPTDERLKVHFRNAAGELDFDTAAMRVHDRVSLPRTVFADAFTFLRDAVADAGTGATPKLTIPSPSMVHYRGGRAAIDADVYPDLEQFWVDLVAAYRAQVAGVAELGCTYLQLDDTSLAYLNDPEQRALIASLGGDPERQHEHYIRTINEVIAGRPEQLRVTTHMCRGNFRGRWMASGGYEPVARKLFNDFPVDVYFLEYDSQRAGDFSPLRHVPANRHVVLGLVSSKSPAMESVDDLRRRIDEASVHVNLDRLSLSSQCGFASVAGGNLLSEDQQWAKMALIADTARRVWGTT